MSRCFKHYDVKQLRQCGCVPATRETMDGTNIYVYVMFASLTSHKQINNQR